MIRVVRKVFINLWYAFNWGIVFHRFGSVGRNTTIKKPQILKNAKNIFIGENVFIQPGIRLETVTKYNEIEYNPVIVIGDRVQIAQNVEICSSDKLVIENDVSIGPFAMINTAIHGYMEADIPIGLQNLISASIRIGEGSHIGVGAVILPGADIGKNCVIGANCVINKTIPDYTVVSPQKPRMATLPYALRQQRSAEE